MDIDREYYELRTYRWDIPEGENFKVPLNVKIYRNEKPITPGPNCLRIAGLIFIVFETDGKTVKEIYELPQDHEIGTYTGLGAKKVGYTHKEWTEEGLLYFSLDTLTDYDILEIKPFGSEKTNKYNILTLSPYYASRAYKWYDENGNKVSSFNNPFMAKKSNKIRIKVREVNGLPLLVEVRRLPPEYGQSTVASSSTSSSASTNSSNAWNNNTGNAVNDFLADFANAVAEDASQFETYSDGWHGDVAGVDSFSERDRTITITRDDGKYKIFKVASDAWIFNKKGKKGKYIPAIGANSKVRYMVKMQNGKEEFIDIRPIIINDDEDANSGKNLLFLKVQNC